MGVDNPTLNAGAAQAIYWKGPISRAEAQAVYDAQSEVIKGLLAQVGALSLACNFLMERAGLQKEEFQAYVAAKVEEAREAQRATTPGPVLVQ